MEPQVKIFETAADLAQFFASFLASGIKETVGNRHFSWVLSGGNTPKLLFRTIAEGYRDSIDWTRVKFFWGDERCVLPGDEQSNYRMSKENLLDLLPVPASNIFRIHGEQDPAGEAARYEHLFSQELSYNQEFPRADLVMLGMGDDGHTASVFPQNIELFGSDKLFEPSVHPLTGQLRITATGKVINHAKSIIMLATGEAKATMAARVIRRQHGCDLLPAALVKPEIGELTWLLDKPAAAKL
jgi:6-phosphogluconolactonase